MVTSTSTKRTTRKRKLSAVQKIDRQFVLTISVFLLNQDLLKNQIWQIKKVDYDRIYQTVKIGVDTTDGKLGTTLTTLRKTTKLLSDYLFEQGLTFRKAKVKFFVDKEEEQIRRIYNILDRVS